MLWGETSLTAGPWEEGRPSALGELAWKMGKEFFRRGSVLLLAAAQLVASADGMD